MEASILNAASVDENNLDRVGHTSNHGKSKHKFLSNGTEGQTKIVNASIDIVYVKDEKKRNAMTSVEERSKQSKIKTPAKLFSSPAILMRPTASNISPAFASTRIRCNCKKSKCLKL